VGHNVRVPQTIPPSATPDEAAAIVAALERFMRATSPPRPSAVSPTLDAWHASAILEGVDRDPWAGMADPALASPWINT
jgi:hypothetical protein